MKIEIIDGAGKRITDGSTIALTLLSALPPIIAMLPDSGAMSIKEMLLVGVALVGLCFKFVRVVP